jgi:hypothetical protein
MDDSNKDPLVRIHERNLNDLENMAAHSELATAAALDYCAEHHVPVPPWLVEAAAKLTRDLLLREKPKKRGRTAGIIARYRQDMIDFDRWNEVLVTRENQPRLKRDVTLCRTYLDGNHPSRRDREKMHQWLGHTWLRAFECATMSLTGTHSRAGVEATRRSYLKVQRAMKGSEAAMRYHQLDVGFLIRLGCKGWFERKRGTKIMPLYDLTL